MDANFLPKVTHRCRIFAAESLSPIMVPYIITQDSVDAKSRVLLHDPSPAYFRVGELDVVGRDRYPKNIRLAQQDSRTANLAFPATKLTRNFVLPLHKDLVCQRTIATD